MVWLGEAGMGCTVCLKGEPDERPDNKGSSIVTMQSKAVPGRCIIIEKVREGPHSCNKHDFNDTAEAFVPGVYSKA